MICIKCNNKIEKDNIKLIGMYKIKTCRICYNKNMNERNKKRMKALKESKWF